MTSSLTFRVGMIATVICCAVSLPAGAQGYSGKGCVGPGNDLLYGLTVGKVIGALYQGSTGDWNAWATSILAAEGTPPASAGDLAKDLDGSLQMKYDAWTCMYSAEKAQDGDTTTAWCAGQGKGANGIGELLVAKVDTTREVRIWSGFGRSKVLFARNNRPRRVRVTVLEAREYGGPSQTGGWFQKVTAIAQGEAELADIYGYQILPLPAHLLTPFKTTSGGLSVPLGYLSFLAIEVLSVYPGTSYHDTLITELTN